MIKEYIRQFLSQNIFLPISSNRRFIFLFHDISDPSSPQFWPDYSTPVDLFKQQLELLKKRFTLVPLEKLVAPHSLGSSGHYASIVFDDGFYSVFDTARPILKKQQVPYAVFVNKTAVKENRLWFTNQVLAKEVNSIEELIFEPGQIGIPSNFESPLTAVSDEKIFMDENDLLTLHAEGILIGSHTVDHYDLTKCKSDQVSRQIEDNNNFLENLLNKPVDHFAIPFGKKEHYNVSVINKIRDYHGYIYTTNIIPFQGADLIKSRFLIPRIGISIQPLHEIMFYINRTFLKNYDL